MAPSQPIGRRTATSEAAAKAFTPEVSRLARQELGGMSQIAVSKASGVQSYILKQWEAGRFRPPVAFLDKLRAYYEGAGVDFDAIDEHLIQLGDKPHTAQVDKPAALRPGFTATARPGFFVSDALSSDLVTKLMDRMGANDDRIAELTEQSFESSFFGGPSDATEEKVRELMGTLAESYLLFRFLQGRNIVARTLEQARAEPATIGEYLSQWVRSESSAAPLFDDPQGQDKAPSKAQPKQPSAAAAAAHAE